ncbi:MAG: hypothetical protein HYX77_06285 [Acidobacteria bacterium]|nr:hypothetical protein [Acidobacteriota bacterium]
MKPSSWKKLGAGLLLLTLLASVAELAASYLYPYLQPLTVRPDPQNRTVCDDVYRFDEHTGWWPKPNLDCLPQERDSPAIRTNSLGLRADHDYGDKAPGVMRIGVFGDSFTFADQVQANETYASIIERSVPNVEVLNFGLGGGGPDQSLMALRHKAAGLNLDAVIVAPLVENIVRTQMTDRGGRPKPYFTLVDGQLQAHDYPVKYQPPPSAPTLRRAVAQGRSLLYDSALWQLTLAAMRPVALSSGLYNPYTAYYNGPAGELLERILLAFREEAREADLIFAPLPTYHYIEYDLAPDYEQVFRRAAQGTGGTYAHLLPAFKRLTPEQRRATRFRFDQHYTALGHRVVGEALVPYVRAFQAQRAGPAGR